MKKFGLLILLVLVALAVAAPVASARPTIVIDAGHGGHDRGGIPGQRFPEKVYALDVAKRVESRLKSAGFKTVMTRSGDYFVGLRQRCAVANKISNSVFLSIHFNSGKREGANGIETYYYNSRSGGFAAAIHKRVLRAAGTEDRKVRKRGFYVIRNTHRPAVLAELGFLTNRKEGSRCSSASHRQKLANALADGVIAMYK
ncbi:MAG: N-acetylmuramoyl-L-alanine amidase [Verrucomicrobiaceae bacterium]|nr:MAG: N-acetylmuramoyl-L-alanine amidase [Verrucomicrobiaceae bacterium]